MTESLEEGDDVFHRTDQVLHVHDLPQLYARPSFETLLQTLGMLKLQPVSFFTAGDQEKTKQERQRTTETRLPPNRVVVASEGVPHYLTSIVASTLPWLRDDSQRERIWDEASTRLSERAGRNAMPSMMRSFQVRDGLTVDLFEPSLTEDNLGLKTWTSSLLLARRLHSLRPRLPPGCDRVLELGAGTGLVGIAAAVSWHDDVDVVVLTDLPEIVPNLQRNVESNMHLLEDGSCTMVVRPLDWSDRSHRPQHDDERFHLILAADPIYSPEHPRMLVDAVGRWMANGPDARFIVELPLRDGYAKERKELRERLEAANMTVVDEGTETGYDDWQGSDGRQAEVECWWSMWRYSDRE